MSEFVKSSCLLSGGSTLSTFRNLETSCDLWQVTVRATDGACQGLETRVLVSVHDGLQFTAIVTSDKLYEVLLVQVVNVFVLILSRQDHVAFRANNALNIEFNFEKVQDVGVRAVNLSAERLKVLHGSTCGDKSGDGHLFLGHLNFFLSCRVFQVH